MFCEVMKKSWEWRVRRVTEIIPSQKLNSRKEIHVALQLYITLNLALHNTSSIHIMDWRIRLHYAWFKKSKSMRISLRVRRGFSHVHYPYIMEIWKLRSRDSYSALPGLRFCFITEAQISRNMLSLQDVTSFRCADHQTNWFSIWSSNIRCASEREKRVIRFAVHV